MGYARFACAGCEKKRAVKRFALELKVRLVFSLASVVVNLNTNNKDILFSQMPKAKPQKRKKTDAMIHYEKKRAKERKKMAVSLLCWFKVFLKKKLCETFNPTCVSGTWCRLCRLG